MINEWMYGAAASQAGGWARTAPAATATRASCATPPAQARDQLLGEARAAAGTRGRPRAQQLGPEPHPQGLCAPVGELGDDAVLRRPDEHHPDLNAAVRGAARERDRHDDPARLVPVAGHHRGEPAERPAGRGHAAGGADPHPGPVRLLHQRSRVRRTARARPTRTSWPAAWRSGWRSTASRSSPPRVACSCRSGSAARPDRADPGLAGRAADARDRRAPVLLPRGRCRSAAPCRPRCR